MHDAVRSPARVYALPHQGQPVGGEGPFDCDRVGVHRLAGSADGGDGLAAQLQLPTGLVGDDTLGGQRLRLRGKGGPGMNGGPAGDVYLQIVLEPHPLYRARGHDLEIELPLTPWEAALGAQLEVPTLEGRVTMKVPPGSKPGQKLRLAGKGLPRPGGGAGDLYAVLDIVVPGTLTEREKKLYEELRAASRFDPRPHFSR